jgi:hypothetical protein
MHAIFAQIEQQRAEHDHERLQQQDAKQPGERFGHDAHQKRRDTAMTKKYAKHSQGWRRLHPDLVVRICNDAEG